MVKVRYYQEKAIAALRRALESGSRRPILQLPTGAGKTVIAREIILSATKKGSRVIFCVPRKSLIDQTVERFFEGGIYDVGVVQANHPMTNPDRHVQVCSVQTLSRRRMPPASLVIIDEAHLQFAALKRWMAPDGAWGDIPVIGLSATPWAKGLGKIYDRLIVGSTIKYLTDHGYLSPLRFLAPMEIDVSGVSKVAGDYNEGQLSHASRGKVLLAQTVENWIRLGEDRPTIAFCVDRAHAQDMQQRFNECGVSCEYIDGSTPSEERAKIAARSESGQTKVVVSIGCLTEGVDWPWISCILHARRTLSHMLWVQSVGRGLRLYPGKEDCILLDCAGNYRLGHPYSIQFDKLHDGSRDDTQNRKKVEERIKEPLKCKSCDAILQPGAERCFECGAEKPKRVTDVEEGGAGLVEIDHKGNAVKGGKRSVGKKPENYTRQEKQTFFSSLLRIEMDRGYNRGWAAHSYRDKFGSWPREHGLREDPIPEATPEVLLWVRSRMIRWAKGRRKK